MQPSPRHTRRDVDRSLWHRAASRSGPDDEVATELEAAAGRALGRGATAVAAAALERAALLSESPARRGSLLVRAAEMEFELGRYERALRDDRPGARRSSSRSMTARA